MILLDAGKLLGYVAVFWDVVENMKSLNLRNRTGNSGGIYITFRGGKILEVFHSCE